MDQYLNVLRLMAVSLVNDRSMTDGHSPMCWVRWVISPFLLSRLYLLCVTNFLVSCDIFLFKLLF